MRRMGGVPSLRRHKATGQGRVTLSGADHYCGPWPEGMRKPPVPVQARYGELIARWVAGGRRPLAEEESAPALTVGELALRYWEHAVNHYPGGAKGREAQNYRQALRPAVALFASLPADRFGPLCLKGCRERMVADGLSRAGINQRVRRIVHAFKWAVGEELVAEGAWRALTAVSGIQKGRRPEVRETEPVVPVDDAVMEATLPFLPAEVAAMALFQRRTGCRPGEVCSLRAGEIDRTGAVWLVRKGTHKTAWRGKGRTITVGPKAQAVLAPFLRVRCPSCGLEGRAGRVGWTAPLCGPCACRQEERGACGPWPVVPVGEDYFIFSPAESRKDRFEAMRKARKSKVQPSQVDRSKAGARRRPGGRYTTQSYGYAIRRACLKAGVGPWSPNQLRHAHATEARRLFGLEAAQAALGHARADVTQLYAERDIALACKVALAMG